jgi:PAS domain S-box-containing protein
MVIQNSSQSLRDLEELLQQAIENPERLTGEDAAALARIRAGIDRILQKQPAISPSQNPSEGCEVDSQSIAAKLARVLAENRRQTALLDGIFEADPGGLAVVVGADLQFVYANPAYRFICPHTGKELIGQAYESIWSSEDPNCYAGPIREAVETGRPFQTLGFERRFPDGETRIFTLQARRIDWGDQPAALLVLWDTTDQKRIEQALRESERLYRAIGESIDYGVWVCEPDGRNIYASDSYLKLVGITQEQCSSFGWGDTLHPDDAERTIAAWKECVRTGNLWDIEHRFRGVDGQWHPILARGAPVRDERGKVLYWAGINLDISRLK